MTTVETAPGQTKTMVLTMGPQHPPQQTGEQAPGQTKTMVLNMGPQHPSTHGVLRVLLELDGENVVTADPDIGYLHTGIEKSCEDKTYSKAMTVTDGMEY